MLGAVSKQVVFKSMGDKWDKVNVYYLHQQSQLQEATELENLDRETPQYKVHAKLGTDGYIAQYEIRVVPRHRKCMIKTELSQHGSP